MKFIGPMQAGIFLVNANVLDHWVWDSLFQNVQYGVTNYLPGRPGGAGGDWGVNRSVFLNNTNDLAIGSVQGFFSSRWNYARGSNIHIIGGPIGRVAAGLDQSGRDHAGFPGESHLRPERRSTRRPRRHLPRRQVRGHDRRFGGLLQHQLQWRPVGAGQHVRQYQSVAICDSLACRWPHSLQC